MKVCVTGGGGYLGTVLIQKLLAVVKSVDCVDCQRQPVAELAKLPPTRFRYLKLDLADESKVRETIGTYDFIVHLAGVSYTECDQDPEETNKSNYNTTETLMRVKKEATPILLSSSLSQYGSQRRMHKGEETPKIVDEGTRIHPVSFYAKTKKRAEDLVLAQKQNIIFRFAGGFGVSPSMRHDNLIHDFVRKAVSGIPVPVYEADAIRQFIHVEDMADAIVFAVQNKNKIQGNLFNIGNPAAEVTKRKLAEIIAKHCSFKYWIEPSDSESEIRNYRISFEKMRGAGFSPHRSLEEGIRQLVYYYQTEDNEKSIPDFAVSR